MKLTSTRVFALILIASLQPLVAAARGAEEVAPKGFDQPRDVPHGNVAAEKYDSKSLGFERKLTVYTPPGYSKEKKYPVLYLVQPGTWYTF